jgi:PadR family transcriptional regulator, regulatory protein PadR
MAPPRLTGAMVDVLALLLQAWDDKVEVHGWLIMKSLHRSGPAVYRVLDRLEDAGWITGTWEVLPEGERRPRRRYYRLTAEGAEAARARRPVPAAPPPGRLRPVLGFGLVARLRAAGGLATRPRPAR